MIYKIGIIEFKTNKYIINKKIFDFVDINEILEKQSKINNKYTMIWFCDLSKEELWRTGYLFKLNIKDKMFFSTPFENIKNALDTSNVENQFIYLNNMDYSLNVIINIISKVYGFNGKEDTLSKSFVFEENSVDNFLNDILYRSHQEEVFCMREEVNDLITIKKNGLIYAENTLENINIPKRKYVILSKSDIKSKGENWLFETEQRYLINITSKKIKDKFISIESLLNSNDYIYDGVKRKERNWLTDIEYKYLQQFFSINYNSLVLFDSIDENFKKSINIIKPSNLSYFSTIFTIIAENYTLALQEQFKVNKTSKLVSIKSTFISAFEKKQLIILSCLLESKGFKIYSYGRNSIKIVNNENLDKDELLNNVSKFGYYIF